MNTKQNQVKKIIEALGHSAKLHEAEVVECKGAGATVITTFKTEEQARTIAKTFKLFPLKVDQNGSTVSIRWLTQSERMYAQ